MRGICKLEKMFQYEDIFIGCEHKIKYYKDKKWKKRFRIRPKLEKSKNDEKNFWKRRQRKFTLFIK
ncbi:hypothetical protein [Anaerocellum danielii]|uniref:Uncharacterized protein n=1 Tax=Anaerocellum danielii TaxID=1387557 RepID=A0ABZ0U284_9FIRM|nr:hypothetical protein [Caldicellulosiruptor danielii]WPX08549.1 hypothetical protein SOJ16_002445 [Caldicellulosiruptor danielii]